MGQAAVQSGAGTLILDVNLDTSEDPPVIISNRNANASSGDKIKWMREAGAPAFIFVDFQPQDAEFVNVDIADNKIESDFETAKPSGTDHPYTILVEYDGATYSSDASVVTPTEGRAVIRN